jgi:hypothetical protein
MLRVLGLLEKAGMKVFKHSLPQQLARTLGTVMAPTFRLPT